MFGTVVTVDTANKCASLQVQGVRDPIYAPFDQIKNSVPQSLECDEIVVCDLHRRNDGGLRAANIRIITGQSEADAIRQMAPGTAWERDARQQREYQLLNKDKPRHRGGKQ